MPAKQANSPQIFTDNYISQFSGQRKGSIFSLRTEFLQWRSLAGIDHVHLSVAIPPKFSVSDFMGYLKGKSTLMLYDRHPELQSKWDKAFWARGYYVETIGNITDAAVQKYINEQAEESRREDSSSTAL